ncbi:MAG: hypothetical protein A2W20_07645 [Candidatus Aminicenantes bacterium RBG_16_66_30]|nr:MAG: hypothetical protein A2W20_07645 [Candidatus Aminicenantes bacterium RBG_16_66_30]
MSSATACSLHRGSENLLFNYAMGEVQELGGFLGAWHRARITYDMTTYTGSVWIDNQPIVSGVPLKADLDVRSVPEISLSSSTVAVKLWMAAFCLRGRPPGSGDEDLPSGGDALGLFWRLGLELRPKPPVK